ncbi:hypothetical protein HA402_014143 [Bradysia odoriphaga]|nr:hypothetical protein HA402_014143 [Bradysia odoriphaga]
MANFGVLRKCLTRAQPFINSTLPTHGRTATILLAVNNSNPRAVASNWNTKAFSLHHRPCRYSFLTYTKQYSTSRDDKLTESKNDPDSQKGSIEDFRAREEQREEEYSSQYASGKNEEEDDAKIQEIRAKIMDASLPFVLDNGWCRQAITKGAQSIGYPGIVHGMFPDGGIELIHYFYARCNEQLIEQLKKEIAAMDASKNHNPVEFVSRAVQLRLQMIEPYKSRWPQALGMMSLPPNAQKSLAHLLTLIDDICYYAGDRSVDIGWYTRRIGLATIYKMTELYMLQDKSQGHADTWTFLERRIEEGHQIQEMLVAGDQTTKKALNSAFQTARNILGLNFDRR